MKIVTDEGIVIEINGDTLLFSEIPNTAAYTWGLFSVKLGFETRPFGAGVWKRVVNGKTSLCLRDRGNGELKVFVSFVPERVAQPEYTTQQVYTVFLSDENELSFV